MYVAPLAECCSRSSMFSSRVKMKTTSLQNRASATFILYFQINLVREGIFPGLNHPLFSLAANSRSSTSVIIRSRPTSWFRFERRSAFHLPCYSSFPRVACPFRCSAASRSFDVGQQHFERYAALVDEKDHLFVHASDIDSAQDRSTGEK